MDRPISPQVKSVCATSRVLQLQPVSRAALPPMLLHPTVHAGSGAAAKDSAALLPSAVSHCVWGNFIK